MPSHSLSINSFSSPAKQHISRLRRTVFEAVAEALDLPTGTGKTSVPYVVLLALAAW
jgi:hypothetical protein